jgi:hypothetical protein
MGFRRTLKILLALLLACGAAQASDWVSVGTIVGATTYVDRSSIRVSENIRRAWIKLVYASHMKRGSGDDSNKWRIYDLSREAFDCAQELVNKCVSSPLTCSAPTDVQYGPMTLGSVERTVPAP